jgi:hypothetical protein
MHRSGVIDGPISKKPPRLFFANKQREPALQIDYLIPSHHPLFALDIYNEQYFSTLRGLITSHDQKNLLEADGESSILPITDTTSISW